MAFFATNKIVIPLVFNFSINSNTCFVIIGLNQDLVHSTTVSFGFPISALAIVNICCSPPDKVPADWSFLSFKIGKISNQFSISLSAIALSFLMADLNKDFQRLRDY